jgi:hypothetical protein
MSLILAGNAPIESDRSKLTLYLMASFTFTDSLLMLYRELRQQSNIAQDDQ